MSESDDAQITCRFTTKLPAQYRVPLSEIVRSKLPQVHGIALSSADVTDVDCMSLQAVPAKLTRYGLSQVVNHVLDLGELLLAVILPTFGLIKSAIVGDLVVTKNGTLLAKLLFQGCLLQMRNCHLTSLSMGSLCGFRWTESCWHKVYRR